MRVMRILAMGVLLVVAWTALDRANVSGEFNSSSKSGIYQASNEPEEQRPGGKFWDHQKEPIPTVTTGEKAARIKQYMEAMFVPCSVRERKQAEKALVELISTYKLPDKDSVEVDCTWSSPLNFASPPERHVIVAFLHSGTGHDVSLWVLCEFKGAVKSFFFEGSAKGCGYWQVCNDLNTDGNAQIIIKHYVGDYDGAGTIVIWPAIYRWDGKNYVRADSQFPNYYAQYVVPKYQKVVEENKDWENHTNRQLRRIYGKCKFVLEKAESIAKKTKP